MPTTIDVAELIETRKLGRYQFATFGLCAIFLFLDGFDGPMMGYVAPALVRDWHIDRTQLGPVLTSAVLGFSLGAMLFGMLADRIGRRTATLCSLAVFGVFNVLNATATSVDQMILYRFVVGLGMGGGMPNAYSLACEYFPQRMRATVIMLAATGYALGNAVCGWGASWLIPAYGWPSMLYLGGLAPLALLPILYIWLPESARYLVLRGKSPARVAALLRKIDPSLQIPDDAHFVVHEETGKGVPVRNLFREGRGYATLLLWLAVASNLLVLSFLLNWFPTVVSGAGLDLPLAMRASAMFSVGGVFGGAALGFLIDRFGADRVLGSGFVVTAAAVALLGHASDSYLGLSALMLVIGFFVAGGNAGTSAYAGKLYPTYIRSTGIGWSLGVGRFAQLLSPILGTAMLKLDWELTSFFYAVAVPALIASVAIVMTERMRSKQQPVALRPSVAAAG